MLDLVNKQLGDFQVEALVGKGSMAHVYRAWQVSLRRPVALKVLKEEIFTPGEQIQRFLREAEALARLEHPHIVPIYAAGEEAPYYFFAMRLVPGGTLADAMQRGVRRGLALTWARQVCQALAFAHSSGVVHRDLKPTNVLLHDDVALLADFGLARLRDLSTLTRRGLVLGTPLYMSPEQAHGKAVGPPSDCFALGVLLYQLLTGEHPFTDVRMDRFSAAEQMSLFQRIRKAEFQPLSSLAPDIPRPIESVVHRAMTRQPENRYPTAEAMLNDLDAAAGGFDDDQKIVCSLPGEREAFLRADTKPLPQSGGEGVERVAGSASAPAASSGLKPLFSFGRYEILGELGHGGQGIVYRARDPVLDREVALKVLQGGWKADNRLVELFRNEAKVAARLNHPHIIPLLEFGLEEESPYLTMPVVDGPSLDRLIAEGRPLPLAFALQVLLQTADALAFVHESGVVHLDIKPGNILVQKSPIRGRREGGGPWGDLGFPHALLTDFTMARMRHRADERIAIEPLASGTVPYAAPEQLENDQALVGPASDIFSLGVVLYEMLTGQRLFASDDLSVTQMLILDGTVPLPSSRNAGIPPEVDQLCAQMLRRRPEERIPRATEVLAATERILEGP
jgi:serine/threonine protein kinase